MDYENLQDMAMTSQTTELQDQLMSLKGQYDDLHRRYGSIILKPIWKYGIQLWGCSADANIKVIQVFQNKVPRNIVNALWYLRDADIHRDVNMETVSQRRSFR